VTPTEVRDDVAGEEPLAGIVRIAQIDRSAAATSGVVKYYIDNVSGQLQEDLSWNVVFMYPPRQRGVNVVLPYDSDVTASKDLEMVGGQRGVVLTATSTEFASRTAAGEQLLATRLVVQKIELVPMVERDPVTGPGTKVLSGRLECVGLSPADDRIIKNPPELWIELENVSSQPVEDVEVKAVFMSSDGRTRAGETGWHAISSVQPGQAQRVTLDLSRINRSVARTGSFVVKVKLKELGGF
jgi:hypothetical protein